MDDTDILGAISDLVEEEHRLRAQLQAGSIGSDEERQRLAELEESLDRYWDLLRQRRSRGEFGENPEGAKLRPASEVEGY